MQTSFVSRSWTSPSSSLIIVNPEIEPPFPGSLWWRGRCIVLLAMVLRGRFVWLAPPSLCPSSHAHPEAQTTKLLTKQAFPQCALHRPH